MSKIVSTGLFRPLVSSCSGLSSVSLCHKITTTTSTTTTTSGSACGNKNMHQLLPSHSQPQRSFVSSSSSSSSSSPSPVPDLPKVNITKKSVWELGQLNHVAIAVPDLNRSRQFYKEVLQAKDVSEPVDLPAHGVTTVFVSLGNTKIELLAPFGEMSPVENFLQKNKDGGIHHICIEVDDIHQAMQEITAKGIRSLDKKPKIGAHNNPVIFLHPKDCGGVLVELEQR